MAQAPQANRRATDSRWRRRGRCTPTGSPWILLPGTRIGPVTTTGDAFSTGVVLPGAPPGDGVAVAQTAANSHIRDLAALRSVLPRVDRAVRGSTIARHAVLATLAVG